MLQLFLIVGSPAIAGESVRYQIDTVAITHDPRKRDQAQIAVQLDAADSEKFSILTHDNIGKDLVAFVDGKAVAGPIRVLSRIDGGIVVLPVKSQGEANDLAQRLASGTAALSLEVVSPR